MRIQERNLIKIHRKVNDGYRKMMRLRDFRAANYHWSIDAGREIAGFFKPEPQVRYTAYGENIINAQS
jgi:hypothetical protein